MNKAFEIALSEYGVREVKGKQDSPQVIIYFNDLGFNGKRLKDETAWCAAFANWCLQQGGYTYQKTLNARSFLKLKGETYLPEVGDIVVLWREREESWKGHVGFFVKETNRYIYILGGNQSNSVCVKAYPKNRLLGYRKPQKIK